MRQYFKASYATMIALTYLSRLDHHFEHLAAGVAFRGRLKDPLLGALNLCLPRRVAHVIDLRDRCAKC